MKNKGQGAIEYLLIIGAAILVVAVVIVALTGILQSGKENITDEPVDQAKNDLLKANATKITIEKDTGGENTGFQTINLEYTNCTFQQAVKSIFEIVNEGKTVNKYQVDICRTKEVWKDTDPCCYTKDGETFSNYGISNCAEKMQKNTDYALWVYRGNADESINKTWVAWCE